MTKWIEVALSQYDLLEHRQQTIDAMQWLKANNIKVRGHVMVWAGQGHLPAWVKSLKDNPAALKGTLAARIREMSYLTKGVADDWDVMNEGFDNHELMDWLGDEAMVDWFKEADLQHRRMPTCTTTIMPR